MSLIRYPLRKRDVKNLLEEFSRIFGNEIRGIFGSKPKIEVAKISRGEIFIVNDKPVLLKVEGTIIPALTFSPLINVLPKAIVDMGAVPHICNGADVMVPGIVEIEGQFREGDSVAVLDEKHRKAISVTRALMHSDAIKLLKRGKALKNLHYVGDGFWKTIKTLQKRKS